MKFFSFIKNTLRAYEFKHSLISLFSIVVLLLMIVKLSIFPYGFGIFDVTTVYTQGMVSNNGVRLINPLFVDYNEADREVSSLVFSGLMKYDPSKRAVVDDMATMTLNEDKTQYTLQLREGLKWHDGADVTAEDVYFTYHDLIMSPSFPNEILKANFAGTQIEMLNDRTVRFTLEKPNIFFVANLTTGIVPEHVLSGIEPYEILNNSFNSVPVGTGPYKVVEAPQTFPSGRMQITLERNTNYYGPILEIEFMRFITYPTMTGLMDEISSLNGVVRVTGEDIMNFESSERFQLLSYELPQYTAVFMNMESQILKDPDVRLALQKSVDKTALMDLFVDKIPVDTPLMQLNQEEWEYQPNVEEAQGALKDAGWEYLAEDTEKAGIRYDDEDNPLALNLVARFAPEGSSQNEETQKVVAYLQDSWESIGIEIQVEFLPDETFREAISSRQYDLLLVGQSLGYNLDTYSYWHSTQADPGGQNFANYKSFQVDKLIEDIRFVFDEEKRAELLTDLAERIREDVPAVFLYRPVYYYADDGKVNGISTDGLVFPSDRFYNVGEWTFAK